MTAEGSFPNPIPNAKLPSSPSKKRAEPSIARENTQQIPDCSTGRKIQLGSPSGEGPRHHPKVWGARTAASASGWDGAGAAPTLPHPAAAFPALIFNQLKENALWAAEIMLECVLRVGKAGSSSVDVDFWGCHQGAGMG